MSPISSSLFSQLSIVQNLSSKEHPIHSPIHRHCFHTKVIILNLQPHIHSPIHSVVTVFLQGHIIESGANHSFTHSLFPQTCHLFKSAATIHSPIHSVTVFLHSSSWKISQCWCCAPLPAGMLLQNFLHKLLNQAEEGWVMAPCVRLGDGVAQLWGYRRVSCGSWRCHSGGLWCSNPCWCASCRCCHWMWWCQR